MKQQINIIGPFWPWDFSPWTTDDLSLIMVYKSKPQKCISSNGYTLLLIVAGIEWKHFCVKSKSEIFFLYFLYKRGATDGPNFTCFTTWHSLDFYLFFSALLKWLLTSFCHHHRESTYIFAVFDLRTFIFTGK